MQRFFSVLLEMFSEPPDRTLLSFDQVQALLRSRTPLLRGIREIPLDHIVGSVGRYRDFNRAFLPLSEAVKDHVREIGAAMRDGAGLPPIEAYQIGDVYFVRDGNHRVAAARQLGLSTIQAYVSEVKSRVPLTPEVDVDDLILKAEYSDFLEKTKLPAEIELTEPGRYEVMLEHIEVHRYYMGLDQQRDVSLEEAAAAWHDAVYRPVVEAIHGTGVLREFPTRTEADLYLWVTYHRERLREQYGAMPPDRAVAATLGEQYSERPLSRFVKSVERAIRAAVQAAREGPAPPG